MIKIEQNKIKNTKNNIDFKGAPDPLFNTLNKGLKVADLFIKSQENLSSTRFIQDTATNWAPKAIFARSKADFAEMSFLEFLESGIFYFALPILGEKILRNKVFNNFTPKNIRKTVNEQIPKKIEEIAKNTNLSSEIKKRATATKAGIVLACAAIPIAEYTLSFAKNLFTLKTFKKSNFNSIANLDKNNSEKEDKTQQERVEKNAKKQLKKAGIYSALGILAGSTLAICGHKSDKLQKISKGILEPGKVLANGLEKIGIKNEKVKKTISKFSLDFGNDNGKLALSKGQLALTAILGLFGYSKAAQDRGKLDVMEVWTRVPLVVFYTIFGGEMFEKSFMKQFAKNDKYKDLIKKDSLGKISVPTREQLPQLAKEVAKKNGTKVDDEFKKLLKQKTITTAIPYAFSLLFMGVSLSAITRILTQIRYNKIKKENNIGKQDNATMLNFEKLPKEFKAFQK